MAIPRFKPGAAGWEAWMPSLCYTEWQRWLKDLSWCNFFISRELHWWIIRINCVILNLLSIRISNKTEQSCLKIGLLSSKSSSRTVVSLKQEFWAINLTERQLKCFRNFLLIKQFVSSLLAQGEMKIKLPGSPQLIFTVFFLKELFCLGSALKNSLLVNKLTLSGLSLTSW